MLTTRRLGSEAEWVLYCKTPKTKLLAATRSSAAERTNFPSEAVEMALAHAVAIYSISGVA
jgi:hypothetical protein